MENLKNIAPIEDFNWEAYENGDAVSNVSKESAWKSLQEIQRQQNHICQP